MDNHNNMSKEALMQNIKELSFVKNELALFLDTHPVCKTAIDYFHKTCEALDDYTVRLANLGIPTTQGDVVSDEKWTWTLEDWPWQSGVKEDK
jgi:spore coat protein JB